MNRVQRRMKLMARMIEELDNSRGVVYIFFGVVVVLAILLIAFLSCFIVQPGEQAMVFSWSGGLQDKVYDEGLHTMWPIVNSVVRMNTRIQKQQEVATGASKDLQDATTTIAVNFHIDKTKLKEIYRTIGGSSDQVDYMQEQIMNPIIQESVKQATAKYTATELVLNRSLVKADIDQHIAARLQSYNIIVNDVSITEFAFNPTFTKAIEDKVTAEQTALKEENNVKVATAIAEQQRQKAHGDADAIEIINKELTQSPTYIQYYMLQKWDGHMPQALGTDGIFSMVGNTPAK